MPWLTIPISLTGSSLSYRIGWMPMPEDEEDLTPAIDVIRETGVASISMLQRRLKIGHAAASDLMDKLEKAGVVGPYNGSQPREILIDTEGCNE